MKHVFLLSIILLYLFPIFAQTDPIEFLNKVGPEIVIDTPFDSIAVDSLLPSEASLITEDHFVSQYDSFLDAEAVVIEEECNIRVTLLNMGTSFVRKSIFRRFHVMTQGGIDVADYSLAYYPKDEELISLKGITYNLVDGVVQ
mgnify:FL=1